MEKQFVTYEMALSLKELGFNEPCLGFFDKELFLFCLVDQKSDCEINTITYENGLNNIIADINYETIITAPLYQQVVDWCDSKGLLIGTIVVDNLYKSTINKINYETKLFHSRNESIKRAIEFAISYLQDNK